MIHIALFEPEIAGNAGNIGRTCLATGSQLHLIRPLGFSLTDDALKRAGMDYWHELDVVIHAGFTAFYSHFETAFENKRVFAFTTKTDNFYSNVSYQDGDVLLFGPESRGLPQEIRDMCSAVRIPMKAEARSLNLSNSAAIAVYEAWRQLSFS